MKKKIIVLFTSFLLMIPVFTVPVHAEDVTLYWDGIFFAYNGSTITENAVTAYNTGSRFLFPVAPTHHLLWSRDNRNSCMYCAYWLIATSSSSDFTGYGATANALKDLLSSNTVKVDYQDSVATTSSHTSFSIATHQSEAGLYYYVVQTDLVSLSNPVVAGHIPYIGNAGFGTADPTLYALGAVDTTGKKYIEDIYYENPGYGFTPIALYDWASSGTYPELLTLSFFSQSVKDYMYSMDSVRPSGSVYDPDNPSGEPEVTPTAEPTAEPTADPSGGSSSSSSSQQQQQQIAEGAVQVTNNSSIESDAITVNISDGITEETVQRLDQTLQNNNPYQTSFQNAITTIDGFRQIGIKFAQTSESFLSFLPDWVLTLLSAMFVLLFFFIILRLLKVFHG